MDEDVAGEGFVVLNPHLAHQRGIGGEALDEGCAAASFMPLRSAPSAKIFTRNWSTDGDPIGVPLLGFFLPQSPAPGRTPNSARRE